VSAVSLTVVGSLNEDVIAVVERLPGRGETVIADSVRTMPGGKGANQAAAAGRLSTGVRMVGRVGADDAGQRMTGALVEAGVDVTHVIRSATAPTGTATIPVERSSGENLILVVPGANAELRPHDVDLACVREADVVLVQLEIPMETVLAAASSAGGRVVLNPAPSQPLPDELVEVVDVLVPNEHELAQLSDGRVRALSLGGLGAQAAALRERCRSGGAVVVTLGARGALLVTADGPAMLQGPPPVDPVDATGAGDCFCGVLSCSLAAGQDLLSAVRSAVAAASLSVTGAGARSALPDAGTVAVAISRLPEAARVG
jgi:ribokinase